MSLRPHSRTVLARLGQALGLLLAVGTLHADQAAFEKANTLYKDGKHAEAAEAYQELSQTGVSANLLFNMGNAYFKAGELGRIGGGIYDPPLSIFASAMDALNRSYEPGPIL